MPSAIFRSDPPGPDQNPIDRALALWLDGAPAAALCWGAAWLDVRPTSVAGLLITSRLVGMLGRQEAAAQGLQSAVECALSQGNLPLAVAGCCELREFGLDPGPHLDQIATVFAKGSPRLGERHAKPPGFSGDQSVEPLGSDLGTARLLDAVEPILRHARETVELLVADSREAKVPPQALFSALDVSALRATIEVFDLMTVPQGTAVIQERTTGSEAFVVARGELEVRRRVPDGSELLLARLVGGALFGEMALLSRAPRAASVLAARPSLILVTTKEALEDVATREPELGVEIAAHCRRRMIENLMRTSRILGAVEPQDRASLVERFVTRSYEPGERLIRQGEASDGLHLIASGEVVVSTREETEDLVIAELGVGEVVGEVALVLRRPANADVSARLPTVTLHLPREGFLALIQRHPNLLTELYQLAIKRDEETSSIVAQEAMLADDAVLV